MDLTDLGIKHIPGLCPTVYVDPDTVCFTLLQSTGN